MVFDWEPDGDVIVKSDDLDAIDPRKERRVRT